METSKYTHSYAQMGSVPYAFDLKLISVYRLSDIRVKNTEFTSDIKYRFNSKFTSKSNESMFCQTLMF